MFAGCCRYSARIIQATIKTASQPQHPVADHDSTPADPRSNQRSTGYINLQSNLRRPSHLIALLDHKSMCAIR
jgi:hypothetical protein